MHPEVGAELADDKGLVLADAELTWVGAELAVLRADQEDLVEVWKTAGWSVTLLDPSGLSVAGSPWHVTVAERLGLTLQQNKE